MRVLSLIAIFLSACSDPFSRQTGPHAFVAPVTEAPSECSEQKEQPVADLGKSTDASSALTQASNAEIVQRILLATKTGDYPYSSEQTDGLVALSALFDKDDGIVNANGVRTLTIANSRTLARKCLDKPIIVLVDDSPDSVWVSCRSEPGEERFHVVFPKSESFVVRLAADDSVPLFHVADKCSGEATLLIRPDRVFTALICTEGDKEYDNLGGAFAFP